MKKKLLVIGHGMGELESGRALLGPGERQAMDGLAGGRYADEVSPWTATPLLFKKGESL